MKDLDDTAALLLKGTRYLTTWYAGVFRGKLVDIIKLSATRAHRLMEHRDKLNILIVFF